MRLYDRGIRRRLAPMLGGDRQRIELAYSLQFTLRGTPVLRYGEEIGMGDDLSLPGRDAIRTPMQWSDGPQAGFTTSDTPLRPVVSTGEFGYEKVNVADQRADPLSLLTWFSRMISTLRESPEVGIGSCTAIDQELPPACWCTGRTRVPARCSSCTTSARSRSCVDLSELCTPRPTTRTRCSPTSATRRSATSTRSTSAGTATAGSGSAATRWDDEMADLTKLVEHSIAVIERCQHPSGGYIASPDYPSYRYCWLRDGSFTAGAMSRAGRPTAPTAFFDWYAARHPRRASRTFGDIVGPGRPRRTRRRRGVAADPLRTRRRGRRRALGQLPDRRVRHAAVRAGRPRSAARSCRSTRTGTSSRAPSTTWSRSGERPCFDWWEESTEQRHTSTMVAVLAGLRAAGRIRRPRRRPARPER